MIYGNNLRLYYNDGKDETKCLNIKEKVYTFEYDYKTNIELTLTNGITNFKKIIDPKEVANTISIVNNKTYYLEDNKIMAQGENIEGEFVNIYFDNALSLDGKIYDMKKQKWEEGTTKGFVLQDEVKPKEVSEYKGRKISTFSNFTTIQYANQKIQKPGRLLVRNNKISLIDETIDMHKENEIINEYNEKEYQTILGKDKKIYDVKTPLKYPKDFINKNIDQIVTENTDNPFITIKYDSGKVLTFNYATGEKIFDNNKKEKVSLKDYIKTAIKEDSKNASITKNSEKKYKESLKLKSKLEKDPIEKIKNITDHNIESVRPTDSKNKYITVYNNEKQDYEVYKEIELLEVKENYESENEKISQSKELSNFYTSQKEVKKETNGLIWIILTIISILIILVLLIKINKNKKVKRKKSSNI